MTLWWNIQNLLFRNVELHHLCGKDTIKPVSRTISLCLDGPMKPLTNTSSFLLEKRAINVAAPHVPMAFWDLCKREDSLSQRVFLSLPDPVWRVYLNMGGWLCLKNYLEQSSLKTLHNSAHRPAIASWLMIICYYMMTNQPFQSAWCYDQLALSTNTPKSPYILYPCDNKVELSRCSSLRKFFLTYSEPCSHLLLPLSLQAAPVAEDLQKYKRATHFHPPQQFLFFHECYEHDFCRFLQVSEIM